MTLLVLTALDDVHALWFAEWARRGGQPCTVLTTEALSFARRRSLRITDRAATTTIELPDGTVVDDADLTGVLNRSSRPPDAAWRRAAPEEQHYAGAELHAFMLGWLHGLRCPVRNRPGAEFLGGPTPHPLVGAAAASAAGLACPAVVTGTGRGRGVDAVERAAWQAAGAAGRPRHVVCLDGEVVAPAVPDRVAAAVPAFSKLVGAGNALVGIDFVDDGTTWWFAGMTPLPQLSTAGPSLVERVVAVLGGR